MDAAVGSIIRGGINPPARASELEVSQLSRAEGTHASDSIRPSTPPSIEPPKGEKARARDLLAAIRTLRVVDREDRPPTPQERQALARFPGFGPLALRIFPDPVTGSYKDPAWQALGEELLSLLTPAEYASARRSTFNAFYTPSGVIRAMYDALARLGVQPDATVLEPGCGSGRFLDLAPKGMRFIGVELEPLSGRIAYRLHPRADIRIEDFRDTHLPEGSVDAAIGNVPFPTSRSSTEAGGCRSTTSASPGRPTPSGRAGFSP